MSAEGRECREVVTQLTAVSKAVGQSGVEPVAGGLAYCRSIQKKPRPLGYPLPALENMFMDLA